MKINKYPLSYTYEQLEGKDLVAHKDGYMDGDKSLFCKKGNIYKIIRLDKDDLEFTDENNNAHEWCLYDVGEYFYPVDKVKDNLYNPVKNISQEKYRRCVKRLTTKLYRSNRDGSCLWMHLSKCGKYYYWCEYNSKNDIIYFRGEVDWVKSNYDYYDQVSKEGVIVSFDSDGVVGDCKTTYIANNTQLKEEVMKDLTQPKTEWTDKHYDFNYTLTEDDIENGVIKIDPYFVAKQWKLGSKDDSGALWHTFKGIARFGEKNSVEREIRAFHAQIKRLAELNGVELE